METSNRIEILPMNGVPEIHPGDGVGEIIFRAAGDELRAGDILIVTHKVVSKAEGRLVNLREVEPSALAKRFATEYGKDARQIEVVLRESRRIVRMDRGVIISETHHGFVCANAGVDASNVPGRESVCLLPVDPNESARRLRERISKLTNLDLPVIVSDSFGRAWRFGITNVAVGVAGMQPLADYRGGEDPHGNPLEASVLAVADEVAAAAELVMNKTDGVPVAIVRGYDYERDDEATGHDLLMPPERDMFR
jgi:coenzyme F420-0:L-glutamate ligase/coenzyme F420-1:gamma-L-glutamate ligase